MEDELLVVYVTAPGDAAPELARQLVSTRVAACVNLLPRVQSIYRWNDEVQDEAETLMIIKTARSAYARLHQAVIEHHPYDTPEVVAVPAAYAHPPYAEWVRTSVEQPA